MKSPQSTLEIILDGKYRLDERLGEGATGAVYRALHLGLKKTFAVKLLKAVSPDPFTLARFRREAEALGQLRHPHVVEVTDFGIDTAAGGVPCRWSGRCLSSTPSPRRSTPSTPRAFCTAI